METNTRNFQHDEIEISKLVLKVITLIKQNMLYVILFLIGGIMAGVFFYKTKTPVYESNMLISTGIVKSSIAGNMIEELQELLDEKNYTELSMKLSLANNVSKLKLIEIEEVEGKADKGRADIIKIVVRTTENGILPSLEKSIIAYLEQNPYVKKRVSIEKDNLNEGITFLNQELSEISKLKANISKISEKGNASIASFDLEDIYRQSMQLFERKLILASDLKTIDNFQVIQGFTAFQKPVSPKLSISLIGGFTVGLILSFIFIFLKTFGKHLRALEKESA